MVDVKLCDHDFDAINQWQTICRKCGCELGDEEDASSRISPASSPSPPEGEIGEIVGRLKQRGPTKQGWGYLNPDGPEAADALTRLAVEREEMIRQIEFCSGSCELPEALRPAPSGAEQDGGA